MSLQAEWTGEERRSTNCSLSDIHERLRLGDQRMDKMDAEIQRNTKLTESIDGNTKDLINLFNSWAGAFKVLEQIGRLAKPVGYCAMAVTAVVAAVTAVKTGSWFKA